MAKILLGISAGIAAYKSVELASTLTQRGDSVITLMTPNSTKFVTPLTFRAVTRQKVFTDTFEDVPSANTEHISLAQWGDLIVIAPGTADLIARMAAGMADEIITTTLLAFKRPVLIAPSMNDHMWEHPLLRQNIEKLRSIGYRFIDPEDGHLACGSRGPGRLATTQRIIQTIDETLADEDI